MSTHLALAVVLLAVPWDAAPTEAPAGLPEMPENPAFSLPAPAWPSSEAPASDAGSVRPMGHESPLMPVEPGAADSPVSLVRRALEGTCSRPLGGEPLSLASALASSTSRNHTTAAYWRLAQAIAAYHFAVDESDFLFALPVPASAHHQSVLTARQAVAKAEESRGRLEALRAQHALAATQTGQVRSELPLTSDLPFVGVYETHFEKLRSRGLASGTLAAIDDTLPVARELIHRQSDAVFAAGEALREVRQSYQAGQATLPSMLESFEHLRQQRRAFLATVLEYNESIAQYAFSVASSALPVRQAVGMLIESSDEQRSVLAARRERGSIRQVSNEAETSAGQEGWSSR